MATRGGEFGLIDAFLAPLAPPRPPRGPGDDAAVLGRLCLTTDAVVEGVHFRRPFFSLEDVGHKALAVNLSDLAAMGARPTWWLCSLGLPKGFTRAQVAALARGMRPLAKEHRLTLVGGNVTSSPVLTVSITAAGDAARPMLRSGARPKDVLFISGPLGAAAAGLHLPALADFQRRPVPQVALGRAAARWASAAIDVSDGLLADLGHLCRASRVGADLCDAWLPRHRTASPLQVLTGGEDYQLLLAVPPKHARKAKRAGLTQIGTLTKKPGIRLDGRPVPEKGFDHFDR